MRLPGATPDSESVAANVTVTGDADHPLEFAIGDRVAVTTGGVLSMFSVTLAEALLPALVARACRDHLLTALGAHHDRRGTDRDAAIRCPRT